MTAYPEMDVRERAPQPYVGFTATVTMTDFSPVVDRMPEIFARLAEQGVAPTGPPFWRYRTIDMERQLVVEGGVPVAEEVAVDGLATDVLPAGRYVGTSFTGHPDRLVAVTGDLVR